jgi:hypothetical protein
VEEAFRELRAYGVLGSSLMLGIRSAYRAISSNRAEGCASNFARRGFSEVAGLYLELLGPEELPEPLPGGLHELGVAHDLADLLLARAFRC